MRLECTSDGPSDARAARAGIFRARCVISWSTIKPALAPRAYRDLAAAVRVAVEAVGRIAVCVVAAACLFDPWALMQCRPRQFVGDGSINNEDERRAAAFMRPEMAPLLCLYDDSKRWAGNEQQPLRRAVLLESD